MGFLEPIYNHKLAILKITVISIIFIYLLLHLLVTHGHSYIEKHWSYFRSKPYFAPLDGFFKKDRKEGIFSLGIKSVFQLLWSYLKLFFTQLIKPVQYIIDIIGKIINSIKNTLDKFREQLAVMRKLLFKIIEKVMERLQNLAATFITLFMRLRDIMKRSFATYQMTVAMIETMGLTLKSMMDGPIGDMASLAADLGYVFTFFLLGPMSFLMFPSLWKCALCFQGNTKIVLKNLTTVAISEIPLAAALETGQVIGKMVFYQKQPLPLYYYKRDFVTGDHYLHHETDGWKQVKDDSRYKISKIRDPLLYCLSTSNHLIKTPNVSYLDFDETSKIDLLEKQKNTILALLNGHSKIKTSRDHLYQEGFYPDTVPFAQITKIDLPYSYLNRYHDHDHDNNNNNNGQIIGIGEWLVTDDVRWYKHKKNNTIVTGSLIIFENNKWLPAYQSDQFSEYYFKDIKPSLIYNWLTDNGIIKLDGMITRDILEVHDAIFHQTCSKDAIC